MQKVFLYCVYTQRSTGLTVTIFIKINLRRELKHVWHHTHEVSFAVWSAVETYGVLGKSLSGHHKPGRNRPGRPVRCSLGGEAFICMCTCSLVYRGYTENLTSPKGKLWREGNGGLPGLLAGVMDKSKACLNCHSVFILRLQGCWLEWLSPNYAVITLLHCNWLGRYANTCHLGW